MLDDDTFLEQLNRAVAHYLEQTGTKQLALAKQLGCHRTTLHRYLAGDSPIPDDVKQRLIAIVGMHELRLSPYLDWLEREYGCTAQLGIADELVQLDLRQVHVPLRVVDRELMTAYRRQMHGEANAVVEQEHATTQQQRRSVFALLSDAGFGDGATTKRLLLLGEAGSGKTMTLRYATLRLAAAYRANDPAQLADPTTGLHMQLRQVPLPIYVRLAIFAATLPTAADLGSLSLDERAKYDHASPDLLTRWIDRQAVQDCGLPEGTFTTLIEQRRGGLILFLDGLDETDDYRRAYLARLITNFARRYHTLRYLVASRTVGYGGTVTLPEFTEWQWYLSPLNTEEAQTLLYNWFHTVYTRLATIGRRRQDAAADHVAQLWDDITHNEGLVDIATNPLLLTAMALLKFNQVRLPDQRAKLYEKLIELLLEIWRKNRTVGTTLMSDGQLASERRRLEALALAMQQQSQQVREVTLVQAQEWLLPLHRIDREEANERVRDLLHRLSVDSGIIQRRDEYYSFTHYSFQEYLAARALDALDYHAQQPDSVTFLLERSHDSRWRETLLLAFGAWSGGQQWPKAERLLVGLLQQQELESLMLAADALVDASMVEELTHLHKEVTRRLQRLAALSNDWHTVAHPDPVVRNHAATMLDRLKADRDRPGLDMTRADYWATRIEPGMFSMGNDRNACDYQIYRPYALARFPVTNGHYLLFLEALSGRGTLEAVSAAQQLRLLIVEQEQTPAQLRPRWWPGARYRSGEGNHPVVGISWYGATAFAWWVDAWLRRLDLLVADEEVRLPTEVEWERAAAYPVVLPGSSSRAGRREYPWGNGMKTEIGGEVLATIQANTHKSRIGGTSVVGIFPHGAADCGAEEMGGNVWEWCSTRYEGYPSRGVVRADRFDTRSRSSGSSYVLRGGSWLDHHTLARSAYRPDFHPFTVDDYDGLRLVRLFSSS